MPSATVFLPVGRHRLLPPCKGLSIFQGPTRPRPFPSQGLGATQIRVNTTNPPQKKVRSFGAPSTKELPLRRGQLISGKHTSGGQL